MEARAEARKEGRAEARKAMAKERVDARARLEEATARSTGSHARATHDARARALQTLHLADTIEGAKEFLEEALSELSAARARAKVATHYAQQSRAEASMVAQHPTTAARIKTNLIYAEATANMNRVAEAACKVHMNRVIAAVRHIGVKQCLAACRLCSEFSSRALECELS